MVSLKKLNDMMDDPRLANGVFSRIFSQKINFIGPMTTKAVQVDKAYDYLLTHISGYAEYADGTAIDDPIYLPRIGITDQQEGEQLVSLDIRNRSLLGDKLSFQELSPGTKDEQLKYLFPLMRYIPNNGVFDVTYTRENINSTPGKEDLNVYVTFLGINIQNLAMEI